MHYYERDGFGFRPVEAYDLPLLAENRNDPLTWAHLENPFPVWPHKQKQWLESMDESTMYFVGYKRFTTLDMPIAMIRLTDIDWTNRNACVGLDVFLAHRGKGYGSELFDMLVEYCFYELNLNRLWLYYVDGNIGAKRVYEKAGFRREGVMRNHIFRNGTYKDYILMGLLREEFRQDAIL